MSRIKKTFAALDGKGALVAYITAGDPSIADTERLAQVLAGAGADIIELGLPFSDPLLDGPVIQVSAQRALEAGTRTADVFAMVRRLRDRGFTTPFVIMTCTNLVARRGYSCFAEQCRDAGVDGVIVTDLPPEEAGDWKKAAQTHRIDTVFLLAPTSTDERIETAAAMASGFIYCVSRAGVTGVQNALPTELHALLDKIRSHTSIPVAVGFGISTAEHVRTVWQWADGAVVGSAIIKVIAENKDVRDMDARVAAFVRELKSED